MPRPSFTLKGETRWKQLLLTGAALVSAVIVVTGPIAAGAQKMDARYVKQSAYDSAQLIAKGVHSIDSLKHKIEVDSIFRMLRDGQQQRARIDSSLRCMTRKSKPGWCE